MPNNAHEQAVLDAALPYLSPFVEVPRRLEEEHDAEFPGHIFDFVGRRPGGGLVAIEVTEAIDRSFRRDGNEVASWSSRSSEDLRRSGVGPGTYLASTSRVSPPMKLTHAKMIEAATSLAVGSDVEVSRDVWLHRLERDDDQIVFAWAPGLGGSVFEILVRLFSEAITTNTKKHAHAANCGFETGFLMTPEWLQHGKHTLARVNHAIREQPAAGPFPDAILVVDLHEGTVHRLR